jgi:hypothetical protein
MNSGEFLATSSLKIPRPCMADGLAECPSNPGVNTRKELKEMSCTSVRELPLFMVKDEAFLGENIV